MGQPDSVWNISWRYCRIRRMVIEYCMSVGVGQADSVWNISSRYCWIRRIVIEYWMSVGVGQADRVWNISSRYCRIRRIVTQYWIDGRVDRSAVGLTKFGFVFTFQTRSIQIPYSPTSAPLCIVIWHSRQSYIARRISKYCYTMLGIILFACLSNPFACFRNPFARLRDDTIVLCKTFEELLGSSGLGGRGTRGFPRLPCHRNAVEADMGRASRQFAALSDWLGGFEVHVNHVHCADRIGVGRGINLALLGRGFGGGFRLLFNGQFSRTTTTCEVNIMRQSDMEKHQTYLHCCSFFSASSRGCRIVQPDQNIVLRSRDRRKHSAGHIHENVVKG
jgi:hypothetical protein